MEKTRTTTDVLPTLRGGRMRVPLVNLALAVEAASPVLTALLLALASLVD